MFDKDKIIEFSYENHKSILLWIIVFLQIIMIVQIGNLNTYYHNLELQVSNLQTLLWVSESPDKTHLVVNHGTLKPAEEKKALIPAKPTSAIDVAYIEKGYSPMDNYYPVGAELIYASSDDMLKVGEAYKLQLLNSGWQIVNIKNASLWQKNFIESLKATNGQSDISVVFQSKLENYSKKAWSFIKIVIER